MAPEPKVFMEFLMHQTALDGRHALLTTTPTVAMKVFSILHPQSDILDVFNHARPLGLSAGYDQRDGKLTYLAIADSVCCRIVQFMYSEDQRGNRPNLRAKPPPRQIADGMRALMDVILCRPVSDLYAFDMGPLSMALYNDLGLRISNAVDIQSAYPEAGRSPPDVLQAALGDSSCSLVPIKIFAPNVESLFATDTYNVTTKGTEARNRLTDVAMRAWICQFLANFENGESVFADVKRINTSRMSTADLDMVAKVANDSMRMDQKRPSEIRHQFEQSFDAASNQAQLNSTHFNNRLRAERNVRLKVQGAHGEYHVHAPITSVTGRAGTIDTHRSLGDKTILAVTSTGRDGPTRAEAHRSRTVLYHLQNPDQSFQANAWVRNIYYPNEEPLTWPADWIPPKSTTSFPDTKPLSTDLVYLNPSQQEAVNHMVSDEDKHRITIIQGPPGTGKTSVIGAYVKYSVNFLDKTGIWLVAQSNVAVKNIAEKLIKIGFTQWRLLVSKDFHFDWHEHLYHEHIKTNVIRSDTFKSVNRRDLDGVKVMLCTISMLSSTHISKFTKVVPLTSLMVDEASQIEIGAYVPIFHSFPTLRKACFIGDDKQLPPFGQEDLQTLDSIFEVQHLRKKVLFLDTQYRMPPQIGKIVSKHVYDGNLKSNPLHPVKDDTIACYFLDADGKEMQLESRSFRNEAEVTTVLVLAEKLQDQGKSFKIITPYAEQTIFIETKLKEKGLDWEDKCFNVDSFQGNEEDYIIVSVVRSRGLGFLNNLRRTNVMLSRCKAGMFIVSSKKFLEVYGKDTLVGAFLKEAQLISGNAVWLSHKAVQEGKF